MKLYIQNVESKQTKNGKTYYVVNGGEYSSWDPVPQGKTIDADIETKTNNGKVYKNIKGFHVVEDASQQIAPPVDRWWLNFVSNICAHAIQSGLIKDEMDLAKWAVNAKSAALALDRGRIEDIDSDLPF